jgi:DNA-directed RNA polymerase specialized sigma24 family protein
LTESKLVRQAIRQAQRGDSEALHFLYVRYAADVLCHVRRRTADDRRAEEVTQRAFKEAIAQMGDYDEQQAPFVEWLLRVAQTSQRMIEAEELQDSRRSPAFR